MTFAGPSQSMGDIAEGARRGLSHVENNGTEGRRVTGLFRVSSTMLSTFNGGNGQGMIKVLEMLIKINIDTKHLNQRFDSIKKLMNTSSTILYTSRRVQLQ